MTEDRREETRKTTEDEMEGERKKERGIWRRDETRQGETIGGETRSPADPDPSRHYRRSGIRYAETRINYPIGFFLASLYITLKTIKTKTVTPAYMLVCSTIVVDYDKHSKIDT
jgi:hypothetical protein